MPLWQIAVDAVGVLLLAGVLLAASLILRRQWIARDGGTFELSLRARPSQAGRGWVLGVGRYSGDVLEFFRIFSLVPRPLRRLDRQHVVYLGPRSPAGLEVHSLYAGHVIVSCETDGGPVELALDPRALTGFLAWLEAGPPGGRGLGGS